ncbi:axonemal dynein light intermediate polypeptide 1 [Kryptolebias marmoratus]|uniref:axonemal dynein light intermediate polypeptide 1 n=1 Tax=Kryptolebias marmoratus TaxID=37003 RepID=UPI0007F88B96|nr:axonemal dynein light intermediate polypeptide 1 [Kryptolebias marmoratus]
MIQPAETLLKYDNPVLIRTTSTDRKSPKGRHLRVSSHHSDETPKLKSASSDALELENDDILHIILPPREWTIGNEMWVQQVSSAPCTRADVLRLEEILDTKLQQRQARQTGICPVRRELYSQCFDELIRQVTINCAERGLLLLRVRNEINMTIAAYQALHESSIAFGMRKALQAEKGKFDLEKRIEDLEKEKQDLTKQLNEQKAKYDVLEKREAEKRQVEEKNFTEKIQILKKTIQQLQNQLEGKFTPKK